MLTWPYIISKLNIKSFRTKIKNQKFQTQFFISPIPVNFLLSDNTCINLLI